MRKRTKIEQLVDREVASISARPSYFFKSEVVRAVHANSTLRNALKILGKAAPGWDLPLEVDRRIEAAVSAALQGRDENGIRIYECYPAGERERRWLRLRAMTREQLLLVMQETRTLERTIRVKGSNYDLFADALAQLAPDSTVDAVYDLVAVEIRRRRAS